MGGLNIQRPYRIPNDTKEDLFLESIQTESHMVSTPGDWAVIHHRPSCQQIYYRLPGQIS